MLLLAVFGILILRFSASAENIKDSDKDGMSDYDEMQIYHTDPNDPDTDKDGYKDGDEARTGYSPLNSKKIKSDKSDVDSDGLSDLLEFRFQSDPNNPDSDGDGFKDGEEVKKGFDPKNKDKKLNKKVEVNLKKQDLSYYLGTVKLGSFIISTGKPSTPTPKGNFKIDNKTKKAWSRPYGLWMPYWMSLKNGKFGFHELPEWPGGKKEGANHLGRPVSHGCIRLGVGDAKKLYDWADIGTPVKIY